MCENADLAVEINWRVLLANLRFRRYGLPLNDQPTAPLQLEVRMLKAEVMETMLYGWSPTVAHLAILHNTHHRLLLRCIGWKRKHGYGYHVLSYADALSKTGCESVETRVRKRRILFAGFVARMGNERLPKRVSDVWGTGGGKGYLVSGRARTGLDGLSRTRPTYHCLTCPPKRNNGCWQLRTRASGSDVLRKRQVVHI